MRRAEIAPEKVWRPTRRNWCAKKDLMAASNLRGIRFFGATILTLNLCVLLGMSMPANAGADGPDRFSVTDVRPGNTLTIRSGPSTAHERIGRIPAEADGLVNRGCAGGLSFEEWQGANAEARAAAINLRWCRIEYSGVVGWVAGRYLAESASPASSSRTLHGTAWRLAASARGQPDEAWIAFSETGEVTGSTGCNQIRAGFESSDFVVTILVIGMTRMACLGEKRAARETEFLEALERTARFTFVAETLILRDEANAPLLTLERRTGN
jgi:heat shock protein HslJ